MGNKGEWQDRLAGQSRHSRYYMFKSRDMFIKLHAIEFLRQNAFIYVYCGEMYAIVGSLNSKHLQQLTYCNFIIQVCHYF